MRKNFIKMQRALSRLHWGYLLAGILAITAGISVYLTGNIGRGGVVHSEPLRITYSILLIFLGGWMLTLTRKK